METAAYNHILIEWFFKGGVIAFLLLGILVMIFFVITTFIIIKQRDQKAMVGEDMMVGMEGVVKTRIDPEGDVFVNSELWRVRSLGEVIEKGEKVVVRQVKGLLLTVEKIQEKGD